MNPKSEQVKRLSLGAFAVAVLAFVCGFGLPLGIELARNPTPSFHELFPKKDRFVALNGGYCRLLGRRECNNRVILNNGYLGYSSFRVLGLEEKLKKELAFARWLESEGIRFLHVQAPMGMDVERKLLPPGHYCDGNESAAALVAGLKTNGVEVLDLIGEFAATPELVTKYFLKGGHHWNYDAAFIAAQQLSGKLLSMFGIKVLSSADPLDPSLWKRKELSDWRLGSHGYRVGPKFVGLDTLQYYAPPIHWEFSRTEYLRNGKIVKHSGGFVKTMINRKVLSKRCYTSHGSFGVHPRVDYLSRFRRTGAQVHRKILILGDSFARPVPAYLCCQFDSVEMIDPRHLADCAAFRGMSVADYVRQSRPDIVVMFINPSSIEADVGNGGFDMGGQAGRMFEFGLDGD